MPEQYQLKSATQRLCKEFPLFHFSNALSEHVALKCKELWQVEQVFRDMKGF
jgi:hypothetical protein